MAFLKSSHHPFVLVFLLTCLITYACLKIITHNTSTSTVRRHVVVAQPPFIDTSTSISSLPDELVRIGREMWDDEVFGSVLRKLDVMRLSVTNERSVLVAYARDDKVMSLRLRKEVGPSKDEYGIVHAVTETDGVIVDVGANVGVTSITAAKCHPNLQVISFEPVPTTYFLLYYNLLLNNIPILRPDEIRLGGRPGVLPVHAALAGRDQEKVVRWSMQASNMAVVNSMENENNDNDRLGESFLRSNVRSVSLESYLKSHGRVDTCVRLLKMDCEGCEFEAIPAMGSFITDRSRVRRFSAEVHQSLRSLEQVTYASKPPPEMLRRTDEILIERGCNPLDTIVRC